MAFDFKYVGTAHEFFRNFDAGLDQWPFHGVIEEHREGNEHRGENRDLQPNVQSPANCETDPNRKVVQHINSVGIPGDSFRQPREQIFPHLSKQAHSQTDRETDEPSRLNRLTSGQPHEHRATKH